MFSTYLSRKTRVFFILYGDIFKNRCFLPFYERTCTLSEKFDRGIMIFMTTKEQIENDMKNAMRAKDELRKRTLRMVLAAIKLKEVEKRQALDETETLVVIQKEVKSRQETIVDAERANRPEQVAESQAEIDILETYLPEPLTSEELDALAKDAIEEVGATSMREMGQVMKVLMPRIEGRATGSEASQTVRKLLG
jgi:uncharacterized protein YqeY